MIFADASALVAVILDEADGPLLADRLDREVGHVWTSAMVRYEVVTSVAARRAKEAGRLRLDRRDLDGADALLERLVTRFGMREVAITPDIGRLALDAAARFGKLAGHPARLNMGDCFAHACATSLGAALLYKGDDFARTDLA